MVFKQAAGIYLILLIHGTLFAQNKKDVLQKYSRNITPQQLVAGLTGDKTGEKEKFDAIFFWVARNIRYDWEAYYSWAGSAPPDVRKTLRKRRGICIDYACLMDTLCGMAGIKNTSVFGYAKDAIFDVNDSIYIDNHAWNAVKLDQEWYLYDVTWTSGTVSFDYTRFSKSIFKLADKFQPKYKQKKLRGGGRMDLDECGRGGMTPAWYYKERFFNKLMRIFLQSFRLRTKRVYTHKINLDYYLGDAGFFAVTHFPDDAHWSLLTGKTMRDFETDSTYYHLVESDVKKGVRGSACPACEEDFILEVPGRYHHLRGAALDLNRRNRFVSAMCEYNLADYHFREGRRSYDSLAKVGFLDSSTFYFSETRRSLLQCRKNVAIDFTLQKKKNNVKKNLLLAENKYHIRFMRDKIARTRESGLQMNRMLSRSAAMLNKYRSLNNAPGKEIRINPNSKINKGRITRLEAEIAKHSRRSDSLGKMIDSLRNHFDNQFPNLQLNVWQKALYHDSLFRPFKYATFYRARLLDNYKKVIVEIRKLIEQRKTNYAADLQAILYAPSSACYENTKAIFKLYDARVFSLKTSLRLKSELVKNGQLNIGDLRTDEQKLEEENKSLYCWLIGHTKSIISAAMGFDLLKRQQQKMQTIIYAENRMERSRVSAVYDELRRRKNKYNAIVTHNGSLVRKREQAIKREKKIFLKSLKKKK